MKNPASFFEIAVNDLERASAFYSHVFGWELEKTSLDGNRMVMFPHDEALPGVSGALAQGESYQPSKKGTRIYLASEDIEATLARVEEKGGKMLYPKTSIGEWGWVAEFEDSEGNCIALHQSS